MLSIAAEQVMLQRMMSTHSPAAGYCFLSATIPGVYAKRNEQCRQTLCLTACVHCLRLLSANGDYAVKIPFSPSIPTHTVSFQVKGLGRGNELQHRENHQASCASFAQQPKYYDIACIQKRTIFLVV